VHHRTIQINHQPDAEIFQFIILTFIYSSTCFMSFPAHNQELDDCSGSLWFTFVSWWQSCCVRGRVERPARPRTQHDFHHDTSVKPEAATAVIALLMMGRKTPETCWAVNKSHDNKLKICCIWLVIYLNSPSLFAHLYLIVSECLPKSDTCVWLVQNKYFFNTSHHNGKYMPMYLDRVSYYTSTPPPKKNHHQVTETKHVISNIM
jgi:hypothetical protein